MTCALLRKVSQQKIPLDPAENTFATLHTVEDDEPATLAVAQRRLRPIQRKTQRETEIFLDGSGSFYPSSNFS